MNIPQGDSRQSHMQAYPESLIDVVYQGKQLYKVIHSDGDDGSTKCCGGEGDKAALPLKSEHSKQCPRAQENAQGNPHCFGVVELFHNL